MVSITTGKNHTYSAERKLRAAIFALPEATIACMAPEPISTAFREYVEAIRLEQIEHERLQTHLDDAVKQLDDEAKP